MKTKEKILLMLLPFWPPQIPPMGISCLKSYLRPRGYDVTTADLNVDDRIRDEIYNGYFDAVAGFVPPEKRGNLYGIGIDVLKNHMMAHINYSDEAEYIRLVKIIIYNTYYVEPTDDQVRRLNRVVDDYFTLLEKKLCAILERVKPTVLGLSVFSGSLPSSVFAFRLVRRLDPRVRTVMGGGIFSDHRAPGSPNLEYFLEQTREYIDTVIVGEGERLFYKLLEGELPSSQRLITLQDTDGEVDLATLDIPDFSGLDIDAYPYSSGFTSRSCPFQCAFCSETVFWGKYRKKVVPQTVAQFERLYERDKTQLFSMSDSLLNPLIDDLADHFIKSKHAIYWDACIRAGDKVGNIENTHQWRRGGFYKAWLGLESGSPRVLKLMNKKISIEQTMNSVSALAHAGIKTATLWLIGFSGETEEDFQQTLDLLEELKDDIYDAEGTPFWYFLKGQSFSGQWEGRTHSLLYPESAREMLMVQTWILSGEPSREVTYQRLNRFIQHLNKLGIPNPYTLRDMYRADERWKRLQKNAVPSIIEFSGDAYIDECKRIEKFNFVPKPDDYDGDFGF
ncbi:MAG: B12-binding domain-containing radical SAM protein [bacterium]|nr:B12-binding domain-containing radical SAM protein [bacterium]